MKSYVYLFIIQLFLAAFIVGCLDTSESKLRDQGPQVASQDQNRAPGSTSSPAPAPSATTPATSECKKLALFDGDDDDGGEADDDDGAEADDDDGAEADDDDGGGPVNPPPSNPTPRPTPKPTPDRCKPTGNDNQDQNPGNGALSFANDIAPILSRSCVSSNCHSTQRRADGVDTESFEGTRRSFGRSLRSIKRGSMPIRGFPRLSAEEIQKLEQWQREGFKP